MEYKIKSDTSNNWGKWNQLKIIQKILEHYTGKIWNQGITAKSHIAHWAYISESSNVKIQNAFMGKKLHVT